MCFKRFAGILHWGPLTALAIIKIVSGMTVYCSGLLWPYHSFPVFAQKSVFMLFLGLTLYNFLSSIFHGPGYLPLKWRPKNEEDVKYLQFCGVCQGFKAPRAHHCRKCGRCVVKMDHHCPWINNCVGWGNHAHFTAFLAFSVIACIQSTYILSLCMYRGIYRVWYLYYGPKDQPVVTLGFYSLFLTVFALGLSIGVVLAVGFLLKFQIVGIIRNRTGIEDWIYDKAVRRHRSDKEKYKFPYDLGAIRNMQQVFNLTCEPIGDGINWVVAEGYNQYSLTREQIEQKAEKRQRTKLYHIIRPASGHWVPITQGLMVSISIPCSDEPRIKLEVDDTVLVTRWNKHWLFGEKVQKGLSPEEQASRRIRGWFPRKCAVQLVDPSSEDTALNKKSK